ncbi:methyltransferase domain-containing protein [Cytobacillus sp. Sa5YUA1]|uniref:Methyltransferase domain-containing protein n=1 Tax=Cytobacillus stercorigallinarum TaxID=2762240 RepID=A0ABR8QR80_9BACI|nr:methyltransferase domain-containing protein [Cytobacillus stercorigallinarum]MBD7937792.1 methyltransferase domain-containing protein [Cytobacillus stercorigallinarum]
MKNPTLSTYWLFPHSPEWYRQISKNGEAYKYPWQSTIDSPIAENIFDQLVCLHTKDKVTLDFGCGDGRFTKKYALYAKQMIGADSSIQFIHTATKTKPDNTTFIVAHSKNELPFKPAFFDLAITRKGPTSIYQQLPHYVKEGGLILVLHPGENEGKELSTWFPLFFQATNIPYQLNNISQKSSQRLISRSLKFTRFIRLNIYIPPLISSTIVALDKKKKSIK